MFRIIGSVPAASLAGGNLAVTNTVSSGVSPTQMSRPAGGAPQQVLPFNLMLYNIILLKLRRA